MGYEFKMRGPGKGYNKKFRRAVTNRTESGHLPMRAFLDGGYFPYRGVPYKEIRGFLKARAGKPVDKVFSEFLTEMGKHRKNYSSKQVFYRIVYGNARHCGQNFYVTNGILNYGRRRKKNFPSQKHLEWNKEHFNPDSIIGKLYTKTEYGTLDAKVTGPFPLGRLWVTVNGMYMLLPVYLVLARKWEKRHDRHDLSYLEDFREVPPVKTGKNTPDLLFMESLPSHDYFKYVTRIQDVENYTRQKL